MSNAKFHFIDEDRECDICDTKGSAFVFKTVGGDFIVICRQCLEDAMSLIKKGKK